jgi:hypothetical protein
VRCCGLEPLECVLDAQLEVLRELVHGRRAAGLGGELLLGALDLQREFLGCSGDVRGPAEIAEVALGVSGPSVRQQQVEGVAILISYLGSPLIQGAMKHYGASDAIVYGVIPAAGPLIIVGTTVVGTAASKADWPQSGAALAVVIAGIVALFVGPSAAWLAAGVGLFVGVVGYSIATAWQHRVAGRA